MSEHKSLNTIKDSAVCIEMVKGTPIVYCEYFNEDTSMKERRYYEDIEDVDAAIEFVNNFAKDRMKRTKERRIK